jgi:integrase/recombinase XerD
MDEDGLAAAYDETHLLLDSWTLHLRSERKSPHTIESYQHGVLAFLRWARRNEVAPRLSKANVQAFVVDLLEGGASASTASSRQISCRLFSTWLYGAGEIAADELVGLKPPKVDDVLVDPLTPDEVKAMVAACKGSRFRDARDEAIIRFMAECTARAREVTRMTLKQTRVIEGTAVLMGKGGKERLVPFGPYTARAIDKYLRARRRHPYAASDQLWLGVGRRTFDYPGLYYALRERAEQAGVQGFHPHRLRHTAADSWLEAGGSEGGLMTIAGWESHEMLRRYTKRRAAVRALDEARRLDLGNY